MKKATILIVFLILLFFSNALSLTLNSINIVKISQTKQTIILKFDNLENYTYIRLSNELFYIGTNNCEVKANLKPGYNIENIILKQLPNQTRIYFKLNKDYKYNINLSKINKNTLIINLISSDTSQSDDNTIKTAQTNSTQTANNIPMIITPVKPPSYNPKNITIVLDPGHGGKDSGAVGIGGLQEKDVVLNIAKYCAEILREKGFKVVMTRDSDVFIPLLQRVKIANDAKADLFVSIHANASLDPSAKGMEIFFLNATSNQKALRIAAVENDVPIEQMGTINKIIISLINQAKLKESAILAKDVDESIYSIAKPTYPGLINRGIDQAPFYVLVGTNCPSILIETLFITNPQDNSYLKDTNYQQTIAKGIALGLIKYLDTTKSIDK
ncbi:N-acetylmuramoyl-L-alanine amidase [Desulfurella multipotens]|uniref:N-acetylmuramoyl-L-alanine amidase n=2 Tax=Desulfurella multipotens TaxID=79269 RepID=A0A1G6PWC2_9BACT|nr:N-acetylmuramoyl-L-alanine amidase [Desulfurella multipotens]SDC84338.1 N-acetylmuramoyl-L-alanine amidase [Desulfurella multipotens]